MKTIPTFETDEEAEAFVAEADLTEYDLSGGQVVRFELKPKDKSVNLRLLESLLTATERSVARSKAYHASENVTTAYGYAMDDSKSDPNVLMVHQIVQPVITIDGAPVGSGRPGPLALTLRRTRLGLHMRAVTQNREMASVMGIATSRLDALTFGLGSGIAGMAGRHHQVTG